MRCKTLHGALLNTTHTRDTHSIHLVPTRIVPSSHFCSRVARDAETPMAGTATEAVHWLLIEDPMPWGPQALPDAEWYPAIEPELTRWRADVPDLRVQLIRRRIKTWDAPGSIRCFVVRTGSAPVVHARYVSAYADLQHLDVPNLLTRGPAGLPDGPLVLTCTNGRRDACCAKWGRPVAQAAEQVHPEGAWQTSHLGGHRFAPTVLVLPAGTHYGWVDADAVPDLVDAHRHKRLFDLNHYRGRVHHLRPVQAACIALRRQRAVDALPAVDGRVVARKSDSYKVAVDYDDAVYTAFVHATEGPSFVHSCKDDTPKPSTEWHVTWDADASPLSDPPTTKPRPA